MIYYSRFVLMMLVASLLVACTVSSRQGSALLDMFNPDDYELGEYLWQASFGGYSTNLVAVRQGRDILFSNQQGDLLVFDGWIISRVVKLGPMTRDTVVTGREGARVFSAGFRKVTHQCQPWLSQSLADGGGKRFTQNCQGGEPYRNTIDVNAEGSIVRVEQVVDDRGQSVVLLSPNRPRQDFK